MKDIAPGLWSLKVAASLVFFLIAATGSVCALNGVIYETSEGLAFFDVSSLPVLMLVIYVGVVCLGFYLILNFFAKEVVSTLSPVEVPIPLQSDGEAESLIDRSEQYCANAIALLEEQIAMVQESGAASVTLAESSRRSLKSMTDLHAECLQAIKGVSELPFLDDEYRDVVLQGKVYEGVKKLGGDLDAEIHQVIDQMGAFEALGRSIEKLEDQIGLLSVKASIEAKKSSDKGSGFNAISSEIDRLSKQISSLSSELKSTQSMVRKLLEGEKSTLVKLMDKLHEYSTGASEWGKVVGESVEQLRVGMKRFEKHVHELDKVKEATSVASQGVAQLSKDMQKNLVATETMSERLQGLKRTLKDLRGRIL